MMATSHTEVQLAMTHRIAHLLADEQNLALLDIVKKLLSLSVHSHSAAELQYYHNDTTKQDIDRCMPA